MIETTLWNHLRPELLRVGKFQKISDRFTPGIPDVLGCINSVGVAIEHKQLKGSRILKTKFRPGQLDWLRDWELAGGVSWVISSHGQTVYVHRWVTGSRMESGATPEDLRDSAKLVWTKARKNSWREFISRLLTLDGRLFLS